MSNATNISQLCSKIGVSGTISSKAGDFSFKFEWDSRGELVLNIKRANTAKGWSPEAVEKLKASLSDWEGGAALLSAVGNPPGHPVEPLVQDQHPQFHGGVSHDTASSARLSASEQACDPSVVYTQQAQSEQPAVVPSSPIGEI